MYAGKMWLIVAFHRNPGLSQLHNPLSKLAAKSLFKSKVVDFYETQLRESSSSLSSLLYFNPNYMSLSKPHPLWTSCSNNSYDVSRAVVQARILSGRYKTDRLTRYLLLHCPSLSHTRQNMRNDFSPRTKSLINNILESQSVRDKVQLEQRISG